MSTPMCYKILFVKLNRHLGSSAIKVDHSISKYRSVHGLKKQRKMIKSQKAKRWDSKNSRTETFSCFRNWHYAGHNGYSSTKVSELPLFWFAQLDTSMIFRSISTHKFDEDNKVEWSLWYSSTTVYFKKNSKCYTVIRVKGCARRRFCSKS